MSIIPNFVLFVSLVVKSLANLVAALPPEALCGEIFFRMVVALPPDRARLFKCQP
jgi:hypothetical protein